MGEQIVDSNGHNNVCVTPKSSQVIELERHIYFTNYSSKEGCSKTARIVEISSAVADRKVHSIGHSTERRDESNTVKDKELGVWIGDLRGRFCKFGLDDVVTRENFLSAFTDVKQTFFIDRFYTVLTTIFVDKPTLQQLLDAILVIERVSASEKLKFLFKLHDIDDDDVVTLDDVRIIFGECINESKVDLQAGKLDQLLEALFEGTSQAEDGQINQDEFVEAFEKHHDLRDQLSLRYVTWLRPKPVSNKLAHYGCTWRPLHHNTCRAAWIGVFILAHLSLAVVAACRCWHENWALIIARCCGMCLNLDCAAIFFTVLKRSHTRLRRTFWARVLPLDDVLDLHRQIAASIVVLSVAHTLSHLYNIEFVLNGSEYNNLTENAHNHSFNNVGLTKQISHQLKKLSYSRMLFTLESSIGWTVPGFAYLSGVVMVVVLGLFCILTLPCVRRGKYFEVFYWSHHLYIVFITLLVLHSPIYGYFLLVPGTLFFLEKVTHILLERPSGFRYWCGDFLFLNVPAISRTEWHPFTISSDPDNQDVVSVHVASSGEWTEKLNSFCTLMDSRRNSQVSQTDLEIAQCMSKDGRKQSYSMIIPVPWTLHRNEVYIDGPYGTASRGVWAAEHAVLVCTGIGVTPFMSVLQSLARTYEDAHRKCSDCAHAPASDRDAQMKLKRVDFVWINRDQKCFDWFLSTLARLEQHCEFDHKFQRLLRMHLYMTSAKHRNDLMGGSLQVAMEKLHRSKNADVITGLKTPLMFGRPDITQLLDKITRDDAGKVSVFFCGNKSVSRLVRGYAQRHGFAFKTEHF